MNKLLLSLALSTLSFFTVKAQCTVTITAPDVAISNCIGPTITGSHDGTGPFTYSWIVSAPGSVASPSSATTTISSSSPGDVIVTLIAFDGMLCTAVATDTITFIAPVDTFLIETCPLPTTICPFDTPIMSLLSWNYVDASGSTPITPDASNCILATTAGMYQLAAIYQTNCTVLHTYEVIDTCGSTGTCTIDAGPDITTCNFVNTPLNATVTPASGGWTYSWTPGTNLSSTTLANPIFNASTPGTYTYFVIASNPGLGCTITDVITIEVFGYVDTFELASCTYPYTLCPVDEGDLMSFLSWTPAGTVTGNCNIISGPGSYNFLGIYNGGCTVSHTYIVTDTCSTGGGCSIDAGPDITTCNFVNTPLNAVVSPAGSWTYSWTPGTNLSSTTIANPVFNASTPGTYTYFVIATNLALGCIITDVITIEVFGYIDTFEVASCTYPYTLCPVDEGDLMSFLNWTPAGTITGNCNIISGPGSFNFTGIYTGGCTVSHTYMVSDTCSTSGIDDLNFNELVNVYPNPSLEQTTVISEYPIESINVLNTLGELVLCAGNINAKNYVLDLNGISEGTYLLKIKTTKQGYAVKRLVKLNK